MGADHPCLHQSAVDPHQHQQAGMATHAAAGRQWPWQRARVAGFYSGLLQGRLLEDELLGQLAHEHAVGEDRTLLTRTRFGLGTMLDQPGVANATYGLGPKAFGHPGAGGSIGFADPERDLAFPLSATPWGRMC
ncbi:serine hydrolase [Pseudomonas aeruginosa]|nr:serine hydrolase [Pseudomonas aeruginosa]